MFRHWKYSQDIEFIVLKDKFIYKKSDDKFEFNKTDIEKIIEYVPPRYYPDPFWSWKIKLKNSELILPSMIIPWSDFYDYFEADKIEKVSEKSPIS